MIEIDERVQTFLRRPLEGEWPYLWLDATYVKARRDHHIVSVAVLSDELQSLSSATTRLRLSVTDQNRMTARGCRQRGRHDR
jgi:hypothetical protein